MLQSAYRKSRTTIVLLLAAAGLTVGSVATVCAADSVVLRLAGTPTGATQITAEFAALPAGMIARARTDDFVARNLALNWYHRVLFARAAQDDGLLGRDPGLARAAAAQARGLVAEAYVRDLAKTRFAVTEPELRQLYQIEPALCAADERIRLARIGVSLARHASEAERKAAQARVDAIVERLAAGESFAAVADDTSDFVESGGGGDMGWLPVESLRTAPNGEPLVNLPVGGRSELLEISRGWLLYEVIAREDQGNLDFAQCRPRLEDAIAKRYQRDLRKRSVTELAARYESFLDIDAFVAAIRAVPAADAPQAQSR
jgi:hypothetical protein